MFSNGFVRDILDVNPSPREGIKSAGWFDVEIGGPVGALPAPTNLVLGVQQRVSLGFRERARIYRVILFACHRDQFSKNACVLGKFPGFEVAFNAMNVIATRRILELLPDIDNRRIWSFFSNTTETLSTILHDPHASWPPSTDRLSIGESIQEADLVDLTPWVTGLSVKATILSRTSTILKADTTMLITLQVLFHGLGGDARSTWTKEGDEYVWPLRWLLNRNEEHNLWTVGDNCRPPNKGEIRVLSVTHELAVGETTLSQAVVGVKAWLIYESLLQAGVNRTPMVFLGHSLGCLVIKEVLKIDVEQRPGHGAGILGDRLKGIIFYGGPHAGASLAGAARAFVLTVGGFQRTLTSPAVEYLEPPARHLAILNQSYFDHFVYRTQNPVPFLNFQETQHAPIVSAFKVKLKGLIVNLESSSLKDSQRYGDIFDNRILETIQDPSRIRAQYQVDYHHLDICRPSWPAGRVPPPLYMRSRYAMARWLDQPIVAAAEQPNVMIHWGEILREVSDMLYFTGPPISGDDPESDNRNATSWSFDPSAAGLSVDTSILETVSIQDRVYAYKAFADLARMASQHRERARLALNILTYRRAESPTKSSSWARRGLVGIAGAALLVPFLAPAVAIGVGLAAAAAMRPAAVPDESDAIAIDYHAFFEEQYGPHGVERVRRVAASINKETWSYFNHKRVDLKGALSVLIVMLEDGMRDVHSQRVWSDKEREAVQGKLLRRYRDTLFALIIHGAPAKTTTLDIVDFCLKLLEPKSKEMAIVAAVQYRRKLISEGRAGGSGGHPSTP